MTSDPPPTYQWIDSPTEGIFIKRLNRFACLIQLESKATKVYLPNSGRLDELLQPGAQVIVERRRNQGKTLHDLLLIQTQRFPKKEPVWAALDSRLPPKLLRWLIEDNQLSAFENAQIKEMEPAVQSGRLDLRLNHNGRDHYIETKSVNLLDQQGVARFPDAPTNRGQRHLQELINLRETGVEASLVFIIIRGDARAMAPFEERDPTFANLLRKAGEAGVGLQAVRFEAGPSLQFTGSLPLELEPGPFPGYWPVLEGR